MYPGQMTLAPVENQRWTSVQYGNEQLGKTIAASLKKKLTTGASTVGAESGIHVEVTEFSRSPGFITRARRDVGREPEVVAHFVVQSNSQLSTSDINTALALSDCQSNCDLDGTLVYSSPVTVSVDLCDIDIINKCDKSTSNCTQAGADAVYCDCLPGFEQTSDPYLCQDVNECAQGTDACSSGSKCTNTVGSYSCECNSQYYWNSTSMMCKLDACHTQPCPVRFECKPIDGGSSYACIPKNGEYAENSDDDWKTATIVVSVVLGVLCLALIVAVIVLVMRKRKTLDSDVYSNSRYNKADNTEMTDHSNSQYGGYNNAYSNDRM